LNRFDVINAFAIAENGAKTISAYRERVRPEMKSPFDFLTPIWYRSVLEFSTIFHQTKIIRIFRFAWKMPFEIFPGMDITTWKKMSALKGLSLGQSALFDALCVQIDSVAWFVEPVTKEIVLYVTLNIALTDAE
jgi:hypothetical protein